MLAGQGIAIIHEVLVAEELEAGSLIRAIETKAPGPAYFLAYDPDHPRRALVEQFVAWAEAQAEHSSHGAQQSP